MQEPEHRDAPDTSPDPQQPEAPVAGDEQPPAQDASGSPLPSLTSLLDFAPDWARRPAGVNEQRAPGGFRTDRPGRRDDGRPRPPPRRTDDRPRREMPRPVRTYDPQSTAPGQGRPSAPPGGRDAGPRDGRYAPRMPPPPPAPVELRFLPDRRRLVRVAQQISESKRAFPLMQVAQQFLLHPEACEVRVQPRAAEPPLRLFQCGICQAIGTDADRLVAHVLQAHLETFFTREELPAEPPTGNFPCVVRCGLSGLWLGPPNHHAFRERAEEIRSQRYPAMSIEDYLKRGQTVRDPEAVEQWKQQAAIQIRYTWRNTPEGEEPRTFSLVGATAHLRANLPQDLVRPVRTPVLPVPAARALEEEMLRVAANQAWDRERHFPASLLFALRGALASFRLHIFRLDDRTECVSAIQPVSLGDQAVADTIAPMLNYITEHPGSKRHDLRAALFPDLSDEEPAELVKRFYPLLWLIEQGHVVELWDGRLAPAPRSAPTHVEHGHAAAHGRGHASRSHERPHAERKPRVARAKPAVNGAAPATAAERSEPTVETPPADATDGGEISARVAPEAPTVALEPAPEPAPEPDTEGKAPSPSDAISG